jgi:acetyl/propionyl-CoA carboxylase alpha subunit
MRDAALRMVGAAGYVNAGTVEFIVDQSASSFYFLEVNARLQVEHPVTEMVTGLDLVQEQLRIAAGEPMRLPNGIATGDRTAIQGHAIEARVVSEDPAAGSIPSIGKILAWAEPKGPGIRVDSGYGAGKVGSQFYDSLIAKVIAHAATREDAISRLRSALLDFHVLGVKTNIAYLLDVLNSDGFRAGDIDTGFLERSFPHWSPPKAPAELGAIAAAAGRGLSPTVSTAESRHPGGVWSYQDGFRIVR